MVYNRYSDPKGRVREQNLKKGPFGAKPTTVFQNKILRV